MNWFRFLRAVEAESIQEIEDKRAMQIAGKLKAKDIKPADWEAFRRHDELVEEYGDPTRADS